MRCQNILGVVARQNVSPRFSAFDLCNTTLQKPQQVRDSYGRCCKCSGADKKYHQGDEPAFRVFAEFVHAVHVFRLSRCSFFAAAKAMLS